MYDAAIEFTFIILQQQSNITKASFKGCLTLGYPRLTENDILKLLLKNLTTNNSISHIDLSENSMTDNDIKDLADFLKTSRIIGNINLRYNLISQIGIEYLAEILKTNSIITTLNLSHNKIRLKGIIALIESLRYNTTITEIELDSNDTQYNSKYIHAKSILKKSLEELLQKNINIVKYTVNIAMHAMEYSDGKLELRNAGLVPLKIIKLSKLIIADKGLLKKLITDILDSNDKFKKWKELKINADKYIVAINDYLQLNILKVMGIAKIPEFIAIKAESKEDDKNGKSELADENAKTAVKEPVILSLDIVFEIFKHLNLVEIYNTINPTQALIPQAIEYNIPEVPQDILDEIDILGYQGGAGDRAMMF